ncbi:MAG: hypothetical protein P3A32_07190 [Gemmatimonadota bacterium]|jgi:hypothetical protein|nr:hypothetical protein [Gemmatimonadota bacterium]MDQ8149589.1 hypothetical protein [Gemmatimonadota bacterium]MDQ8156589.1 hypothetical protein [Gemmatimonadota bacterium]MDQ8176795.1 hypothetical protein [Gemmatimonadota bacterium]
MRARLLLPVVFVLAACERATGPTDSLTAEEASAAFAALQLVGYSTMEPAVQAGDAALRAPTVPFPTLTQADTIALSRSCPAGGRSSVVAIVATDSTQMDLDIRQRFADCAVTTDSGRTWTFDADPGLRTRMALQYAADNLSFTGSIVGAFTFALDGRSGRCTVDIDLVLVTPDTDPHIEARGTFCGRTITEAFDPGI